MPFAPDFCLAAGGLGHVRSVSGGSIRERKEPLLLRHLLKSFCYHSDGIGVGVGTDRNDSIR